MPDSFLESPQDICKILNLVIANDWLNEPMSSHQDIVDDVYVLVRKADTDDLLVIQNCIQECLTIIKSQDPGYKPVPLTLGALFFGCYLEAATPDRSVLIEDDVTAVLDSQQYTEAVELLVASRCQVIYQIAHRIKPSDFPEARVYTCYIDEHDKTRMRLQQSGSGYV